MRKLICLTLSIALSFLSVPAHSSGIASQLATNIQKSGIGCNDIKVGKDKVLFGGKRVICTVNGERVNIESYTSKNFKKMVKYLCESGFSVSAVSNSKTWIVSADSDETNQAIAKALKAKVVKFCG